MHSNFLFRALFLVGCVLLFLSSSFALAADDYIPEVTDRVARISWVGGDVKVKRAGSDYWEAAVLNLPLVEGDEVATEANGRVEIQFNAYLHVRIAENSFIGLVVLQDAGVALSLPHGTASVSATRFDGSAYFEVDMPKTTAAVQRPGTYRFDAGVPGITYVRVAATDGGELRLYTPDSGFTVKSGRSVKLNTEGVYAGEWDSADASSLTDEFDKWSADRAVEVELRMRDSYYGTYYDSDIYGAEDLNQYGEWMHTRDYGYVWRPYQSAIGSYVNWSPYRYGQWRWIPPFGWTWVNDEPWGWATYHHGRWFWDNGHWYWTPYGYYRYSRSWWRPALVVISIYGGNICWYPLPYHYAYYNYNHHYYSNDPRRTRRTQTTAPPPITAPSPTPPTVQPAQPGARDALARFKRPGPPLEAVPPSAVVTVAREDFGRERTLARTANQAIARQVLSRQPEQGDRVAILPAAPTTMSRTRNTQAEIPSAETGAVPRRSATSLDGELRRTRIQGERPPLQINTGTGEIRTGTPRIPTGAVGRPASPPSTQSDPPSRELPPVRAPRYEPPATRPTPVPRSEPIRSPRYEAPQQRAEPVRQPSADPPTRRTDPAPRSDPPPTRSAPPPKSDPPAQKDVPEKPPATAPVDRKKDGR